MKRYINILAICMLLSVAFFACKPSTQKDEAKQFVIKGEITGSSEQMIYLHIVPAGMDQKAMDSTLVKDGKFEFKGDIPIPSFAAITFVKDKTLWISPDTHIPFRLTDEQINLKADAAKLAETVIEGDLFNKEYKAFIEARKKYSIVPVLKELKEKYYKMHADKSVSAEEKHLFNVDVLEPEVAKRLEKEKEFTENYIKEHPKSDLSVLLLPNITRNKSAGYIEQILNYFDPAFKASHPLLKIYNERLVKLNTTDVGLGEYFTNVPAVSYTVDQSFQGNQYKNVRYLASMSADRICGLKTDGSVVIFDSKGLPAGKFSAESEKEAVSVATGASDNIYIAYETKTKKNVKHRGRTIEKDIYSDALCIVYNQDGKKLKEFTLKGIKSATGSKVHENKLVISDSKSKKIAIFDAASGNLISEIDDMRSCCDILDIAISNKRQILVGNLGAFRVTGVDFKGKRVLDFGQRGHNLEDFAGCCNPVSVASLSNGAIVTVEKDPTRIKIYSSNGAIKIEGVDELVEGCRHIPMAVDGKDQLYLASPEKGVIKCVAKG